MTVRKNRPSINSGKLSRELSREHSAKKREGRTGQLRKVNHKFEEENSIPKDTSAKVTKERKVGKSLPENLIYFFKYIVKKLKPETLMALINELAVAAKKHDYGVRYDKGIPEAELKYFINPRIVVVRGARLNPFCHSLLCFSDEKNENLRFCQINDLNNYPEFMNQDQFLNYMKAEGGTVEYVYQPEGVNALPQSAGDGGGVPDLKGMQDHIKKVAKSRWLWGGAFHNCFSFCLQAMKAGGCDIKDVEFVIDLPAPAVKHQLNKPRAPKRVPDDEALKKGISGPILKDE